VSATGAPTVHSASLGGSALARAVVAGAAPPAWYEPIPTSADGWRRRAEEARRGDAWLRAMRPAITAVGAAQERLARAARDGVLVTTGQQPGLFGGPIYTWSKALSALALADALERATGVPTAPLFWAATDDADFDEAATTHVAVAGGLETIRLARPSDEHIGRPLATVPLGDAGPLLEVLERATGSAAFPDVLRAARGAYAARATVGEAYVRLLAEVLNPLGIAVLDASNRAVREGTHSVVREALLRAQRVEDALAHRARELEEAGYAPQVEPVAGLSLVFSLSGPKERVRVGDAAGVAGTAPAERLSPNVLLRPVAERALLPTVAYVAGPGELAYFAQATAVADALDAPRPLAVPRWSGLIVEPHVQRLLDRRGLTPGDLVDPSAPERALAQRAMPGGASEALDALRRAIDAAAVALAATAEPSGVGAPAPAVVDGARRALLERVARLERRFLSAAKRGETAGMRDLASLRAALRPLGRPQERTLNLLPMLARHGPALLEQMLGQARGHADALVGAGVTVPPREEAVARRPAGR
jgi:bacillithiol biosynthesis cysteine-adding enzyme BshC